MPTSETAETLRESACVVRLDVRLDPAMLLGPPMVVPTVVLRSERLATDQMVGKTRGGRSSAARPRRQYFVDSFENRLDTDDSRDSEREEEMLLSPPGEFFDDVAQATCRRGFLGFAAARWRTEDNPSGGPPSS